MAFTVPYHLDPLRYERKALGPFTSRELRYGGIGIVVAFVVGVALWNVPSKLPELFRVMPAVLAAAPFLYLANVEAPPGYDSPEQYVRDRVAEAFEGEQVYVYGCDDEECYEAMEEPPAKGKRDRKEAEKVAKGEREYRRGRARSAK